MGTFDVTCGVTHLPILAGDPCRFLFLRQVAVPQNIEDGDSTWQHSWARWLPLSLPIKGEYDGYGRVMYGEGVPFPKDPLLDFQVEAFERVRQEVNDDTYDYLQGNPIDNLITMCERGALRVKIQRLSLTELFEPVTVRVSPYYVSEAAWQLIVTESPWRSRMTKVYERAVQALRRTYTESKLSISESWDVDTLIAEKLLSALEENPDLFVLGSSSILPDEPFASMTRFTEKDWNCFAESVIDLQTFYHTLQHNLRRTLHPELHTDQFRYADMFYPEKKGADLQKSLLHLTEQRWEELARDEEDEDT